MRDAGLFSLWVPAVGGAEVDVETSVRVVEELSRLDGAVGWNVMIAGNTSICGQTSRRTSPPKWLARMATR